MNRAVNTNDQKVNHSSQKLDHLEKLQRDLQAKKAITTEVGQIEKISLAEKQILKAIEEETLNQQIVNNQASLGQYRQVEPAIKPQVVKQVSGVISDKEAEQIKQIRAVPTVALAHGQKFASLHGPKEPSLNKTIGKNREGLWELLAIKEANTIEAAV